MLAALRDIGVTVIVPVRQRPDVTPYTANSISIEIDLIRHRLDAKNLFTLTLIRIHASSHTASRCNFPNPSLTRHPSLVQRFPFLSKAMGWAPGTPEAKMVAMGGFLALGLNV